MSLNLPEVDTDLPDSAFLGQDQAAGLARTGEAVAGLGAPTYPAPELPDDWGETSSTIKYANPQGGGASGKASDIVAFAKQFLGDPYVWGGTKPGAFDCSGLIQYVYKHFGVDLPRISAQQADYGKRVSQGEAKPGDLVAWDENSRNNGADHIGLYIGNGMVLHAPKTGDVVKISKIWGSPWFVSMGM